MTVREFTAMKSATSGDDRSKLRHFGTTAAGCEKGTPSFTVAVIKKLTQGQYTFISSKTL
jgi:hypothetical protein